ncbi:hypothetical protein G6F62_014631 [Rhizopus arrhizus]|nr:hypothetical protein G6F62_014631 [Rhizopus arrhizus]
MEGKPIMHWTAISVAPKIAAHPSHSDTRHSVSRHGPDAVIPFCCPGRFDRPSAGGAMQIHGGGRPERRPGRPGMGTGELSGQAGFRGGAGVGRRRGGRPGARLGQLCVQSDRRHGDR